MCTCGCRAPMNNCPMGPTVTGCDEHGKARRVHRAGHGPRAGPRRLRRASMAARTFSPRPSTRASIGWPGSFPYAIGVTGAVVIGLVARRWSRRAAAAAEAWRREAPRMRHSGRDWTMSSATSIDRRRPGLQTPPGEAGEETRPADAGFHVGHFFVLLSLIAATVAVIMTRDNPPQHLILISLTVGAAGLAAHGFYSMLAPFAFAAGRVAPSNRSASGFARISSGRRLSRSDRSKSWNSTVRWGSCPRRTSTRWRAGLRARAIGIDEQLDSGGYREIIERDLAARIGRSPSRSTADGSTTPSAARAKQTGWCECGVPNDQDARFCKACGSRLGAA